MAELTYDEISKLLKYDPETGKLFWLPRPVEMFSGARYGGASATCKIWNTRHANKEALTSLTPKGYMHGGIHRRLYSAHRVAWLLHSQRWPIGQLDHINGIKTDNRILNLREVSVAENQRNRPIQKNNKSGFCGVSWHSHKGQWAVRINSDGRTITVGYYSDLQEAVEARSQASIKHGYHPNHGRSAT